MYYLDGLAVELMDTIEDFGGDVLVVVQDLNDNLYTVLKSELTEQP